MQALLNKLSTHRVKYESYKLFIESNPFLGFEQVGEGFIFRGESDGVWTYFVCDTPEEFQCLLPMLSVKDLSFSMVEDYMFDILSQRGEIEYDMHCMRLYLPDEVILIEKTLGGACIRKLTVEDVPFLYANYLYGDSVPITYFESRIKAFGGYGIQVDGQLAGWILTHDDSALGMLHILEAYRGRGFAEILTTKLCIELRQKGILPHLAIKVENKASMGLAIKLGFVKDKMIHWLKLKG